MGPPLITISGPSGVGKTSVVKALLKQTDRYVGVISHTTRPPRPEEKQGVDYFFIDELEFNRLEKQNQFLDSRAVYTWRYGISRTRILGILSSGQIPVANLDVTGALKVNALVSPSLSFFILPPSMEELSSRLRGRTASSKEDVEGRLRHAEQEILLKERFDYVIVNTEISLAANQIHEIIGDRFSDT